MFFSDQLWFIAVIVNFILGVILAAEYLEDKVPGSKSLQSFMVDQPAARVIFGLLGLVVGFLKLFIHMGPKEHWVIFADFFPAVLSILAGLILLWEYYQDRTTVESDRVTQIGELVSQNKTLIGVLSVVFSIVHFFFNGFLFI
jgi:uncharacterized membrane protein